MSHPTKELQNRIQNIIRRRPDCYEVRVMRGERPDLVVWRKSDEAVKATMQRLGKLDGVTGFAVTQQNARFKVHDSKGTFMEDVGRHVVAELPTQPPAWDTLTLEAAAVLDHPTLLTCSFPCVGSPVNLEANHVAIFDLLTSIQPNEAEDRSIHDSQGRPVTVTTRISGERGQELINSTLEQMVMVSCANTGGGDALYLDVGAAPERAQNCFLDNYAGLKNGSVISWPHYDREFLLAALSYREACVVDWICQASKMSPCVMEMTMKIGIMPAAQRQEFMQDALTALLPHITHWISENGEPIDRTKVDKFEPSAPVKLPASVLACLN